MPDVGVYPGATLLQGADWGINGGRRQGVRAVVVHTTQGNNSVGVGQSRHHDTPGTFNFLIEPDGRVYQFYPADVRCSHAAGANHAGPGIELEGFTGVPRPGPQLAALGALARWLASQYGVPLTYRTGDPRDYVDQSGYRGFIAHRGVDYPPDHSLLHFDEITPAEWSTALGAGPAPSLPIVGGDDVYLLKDRNAKADEPNGYTEVVHLTHRGFPAKSDPTGPMWQGYIGDLVGKVPVYSLAPEHIKLHLEEVDRVRKQFVDDIAAAAKA